MKAYVGSLATAALLLLGSSVAYGQQHQVKIDDTGTVIAANQHMHAKVRHTVTWSRSSGASKSWFVTFTGDSPCAEGKTFGSAGVKVCTINAACKAKGDAGCKPYAYQSATGPGAQLNDPDVIVDP